ncbi:MAG: hypothetical protein E6H96_00675 [Chloroflexi bacterium]|nr:MAG: hypothetical protein E6H96_00675 [Chloroflexota bacterium]
MPHSIRRLLAYYGLNLRLLRTWRLGRRALIRRLILTTLVAYVSLATAIYVVPGISASGPPTILAAVVAIALLNTLLRPVLLWLAIALGVVGLAVLATALQFVVILVVGALVPGFHVSGLSAAVEGALVFAIVNTAISWFIALGEDESYFSHLVRLLIREDAPKSDQAGLVIVQIDGLSRPVLVNQMRAGRVPTMSRWLRSSSHRLVGWECQLPSQTSASQAGILLGSNDDIPAFRWYEKATGRLMVSNHPSDAAEIEARLSTGRGLLDTQACSIGNLFSGGAGESILTMSRLSNPAAAVGPVRSWFYFFVSPFALARALLLTLAEAGKEVWQARRQRVAGIEPRIARGGSYPLLRAVTNVSLRQLTTALIVERVLRGVPMIYADFVDYDEIAHHAGPERAEALEALDGVDHVLGAIERVVGDAPRPYRLMVLSDHGQSQGATFRQRYGVTIEDVVRGLMGGEADMKVATSPAEPWGPVSALLSEVGRAAGFGGRLIGRMFQSRSREGFVDLGPGREERYEDATGKAAERPDLVVCASGNLALVYLNARPERLTLEEIDGLYPRLVPGLAGHDGIGFVLVRSAGRGALVLGPSGRRYLDEDGVEGDDPLAPFGPGAADDLRRLDAMPSIGDLVLNSRLDPGTDEVAAFEELVGSHGGLGGWQTEAFLLYPGAWEPPTGPIVGAPAVHRQLVAWLVAAGMRTYPDDRAAEKEPQTRVEPVQAT